MPEDSKSRDCCSVWRSVNIQGIHKRMVRFQKLKRNLFLTLHGHVHSQQRQLSKVSRSVITVQREFRARFGKEASCDLWLQCSVSFVHGLEKTHHAICDYSAAWVSCTVWKRRIMRSVITAQREFRARFGKDASCVFSKPRTKLTKITDLDTSKRSTQKAFSCCDAILETGPAAPQ